MAYGTDMVLSYLGEVSLGHTIFWAGGGYVAAAAGDAPGRNGWLTRAAPRWRWRSRLAAVLGLATLRHARVRVLAGDLRGGGGRDGDHVQLGGARRLRRHRRHPAARRCRCPAAHFSGSTSAELWPVASTLLMLTLAFIHRFRRSRLGLAALMVQMHPDLARRSASTRAVRLRVFVISAPISALAGWLYAYQRAYVGPDMFESYFLVLMLTAAVLAGRRVLLGPVIGTALILLQQNYLSLGGDGDRIVLGLVLAGILIFWPQGLVGLLRVFSVSGRTGSAGRASPGSPQRPPARPRP